MRLSINMPDAFIEQLENKGWKYIASPNAGLQTPSRYVSVSEELREFIASFDVLCSEDETQWLVSAADYQRRTGGFNWDEFEKISLQAAEGDLQWQQKIKSFWDSHLPIFMRVDGEYAYVAYCCAGENAGHYVSGSEPEFEEVSVVGSTLDEFKAWLLNETDA